MGPTSLKTVLKQLGVHLAFTPASGLGNVLKRRSGNPLVNAPVFVSDVLHSVVVKVDEEGTVAAAVTTVIMAGG